MSYGIGKLQNIIKLKSVLIRETIPEKSVEDKSTSFRSKRIKSDYIDNYISDDFY